MSDADNFGASHLWRVASCSFKQATFAAQLWGEIHSAKDGGTSNIRSCAQRHKLLSTHHINKATATIKRYSEGDHKDEVAPLEPLLLTDLEELRSKLSLIGGGRMAGEVCSQIAEGATLLYLSNCLSQMAIVAMVVRRECTRPMKKLSRRWYASVENVPLLASYCTTIAGAFGALTTVGNIVRSAVKPTVTNSPVLPHVSQRVAIGSVMHTINNRLAFSLGYLGLIMNEAQRLLDGDYEGLNHFRGILEEWEDIPDALARTAISDDEPIIYIGKQYGGIELIVDGSVPKHIDVTNLNIIVGHFVNNSLAHPHPERELKVVMLQTAHGIYVTDNGTGISLERLQTIERPVREGRTVQTDHEGGTGSGLRDSILLLDQQAMITVASKEGSGTISSITWCPDIDEVEFDIVPDGWNYIQFSIEAENETARRADSCRLPRPISDIIATHDSIVIGMKTSA